MAKFYVQSGLFEIVVQAGDGEGAALWAVHRYLQACDRASQQLFVLRQAETAATRPLHNPAADVAASDAFGAAAAEAGDPPDLAGTIRCSEIGFGRCDRGVYLTNEVLQKYTELLHALGSLGI